MRNKSNAELVAMTKAELLTAWRSLGASAREVTKGIPRGEDFDDFREHAKTVSADMRRLARRFQRLIPKWDRTVEVKAPLPDIAMYRNGQRLEYPGNLADPDIPMLRPLPDPEMYKK